MINTPPKHGVVQITVEHPTQLVGFLVEHGNCEHAKHLFETKICQQHDPHIGVQSATAFMHRAKQVMESEGYICGEVLNQSKADWLSLILERPLTDEEYESAVAPYEEDL